MNGGPLRTVAPAKINWTLEVLGRRNDGYHEIRSVMQTIDLCDELSAERAEESAFETVDGRPLPDDDLIVRAARGLEERVGRALPARIRVEKRIPVASGLGGGSSDAAAVLRLLNKLYALGLSVEELAEVGAGIGSDVPFFVYGGTALVEGRGERVAPLPNIFDIRVLIVAPSIELPPDKTHRMFSVVRPHFYTDGWKSLATAERISGEEQLAASDLWNIFDATSINEFGIARHKHAMEKAGVEAVHVCGSGPSLYGIPELNRGDEMASRLRKMVDGQVYVAWTMDAWVATAVTD